MKQKVTRDELLELLRRNVTLYRDDEIFVQYIFDLATYLVEYRLHQGRELEKARAIIASKPKLPNQQQLAETRKRDQELQAVLRKHAGRSKPSTTCRMCGAPTNDKVICPHCGNMT